MCVALCAMHSDCVCLFTCIRMDTCARACLCVDPCAAGPCKIRAKRAGLPGHDRCGIDGGSILPVVKLPCSLPNLTLLMIVTCRRFLVTRLMQACCRIDPSAHSRFHCVPCERKVRALAASWHSSQCTATCLSAVRPLRSISFVLLCSHHADSDAVLTGHIRFSSDF